MSVPVSLPLSLSVCVSVSVWVGLVCFGLLALLSSLSCLSYHANRYRGRSRLYSYTHTYIHTTLCVYLCSQIIFEALEWFISKLQKCFNCQVVKVSAKSSPKAANHSLPCILNLTYKAVTVGRSGGKSDKQSGKAATLESQQNCYLCIALCCCSIYGFRFVVLSY